MKWLMLLTICIFLLLTIPQAHGDYPWVGHTSTFTWHLRNDTQTINGQLGYILNTTTSDGSRSVSENYVGFLSPVYYAVKCAILKTDNSSTTLTTSYNSNVSRTSNGEGIQTITWTPEATVLTGGEAIKITVAIKVGGGAWMDKAVFVSNTLLYGGLSNTSWSIKLYTVRTTYISDAYGFVYWGNTTYASRIENVVFNALDPWSQGDQYLREHDLVSWLLLPWNYISGLFNMPNLMYMFAVLFIELTMYNKYEDVRPPIVFLWLFGGAGGFLTLMIPALGLHLAWFILAFALASTLYLLLR